MKINRKIRIKVIRRIIKRLEKIYYKINPYGYKDSMKYYYLIEYWEDKLKEYE